MAHARQPEPAGAWRRDGRMLDVLGLDELEVRAYRRLVALPSEAPADLAEALGSDDAAMTAALEGLEAKGLVARSMAVTGHVVASPPRVALGSLIVQRQEELRRAQLELTKLTEQYRGAASERTASDVIDVVRGPQAVAQRFAQLQRGASTEVVALVKAGVVLVSADDNVDEEVALARGVRYRVVLERAAFERPGFFDAVVESVEAGEEVRVTDELPLRMIVADRQLALLPLQPTADDSGAGALLVHPSGLLDALLALVDLVWDGAQPVPVPGAASGDEIDPVDVQVLTLLLAGLTDAAIGGQLGMSLRTVQRRVHQLMARARVATRFQLGHEACRRGWLAAE